MMRYSKALACAAALLGALTGPARADDRAVQRGQYLAILGDCSGCHTTQHGAPFAGGLPFTAAFGTVYSTNITPDKETGIGNWTGDQFYRALHQGIAADGHHLYPAFPYIYFTRISRSDSDALFAYLKSLKPVHQPATPNRLLFPFNIRAVMMIWNWLYLDDKRFQPDPRRSASWNRGNFIVNGLGHCAACHTPKNILFGDKTSRALTGATLEHWYAANLTGTRAGFLLCGDFDAARAILTLEDASTVEQHLDDLVVFVTSDRYTNLRRQIGIADLVGAGHHVEVMRPLFGIRLYCTRDQIEPVGARGI